MASDTTGSIANVFRRQLIVLRPRLCVSFPYTESFVEGVVLLDELAHIIDRFLHVEFTLDELLRSHRCTDTRSGPRTGIHCSRDAGAFVSSLRRIGILPIPPKWTTSLPPCHSRLERVSLTTAHRTETPLFSGVDLEGIDNTSQTINDNCFH